MAYFPNGTAGTVLDEQCDKCLLLASDPCPILLVQLNYNYEQLDKEGKENKIGELLNCLVDEKGICQMAPLLHPFKSGHSEETPIEKYAMETLKRISENEITKKL